ncbi:MAG: TetR/AcrR family transcriptional regulator [Eubacteriaceae bacterium]|jgi:AcrR family transcriptional regulator|nr:TetR/AcrR family transcriptional regulator [Eubacteriaceae bacterium]
MTRQEKSELTREKIYNSALKLIDTKGFDNITVDDITTKAGVAKGTFYIYFPAKEDVLYYTYQHLDTFYQEALDAARTEEEFPSMVKTFIDIYSDRVEELGLGMISAICTNLDMEKSKESYRSGNRSLYKSLYFLVSEGIRFGFIDPDCDRDWCVRQILIAMIGMENYYVIMDGQISIKEMAMKIIPALLLHSDTAI